MNYMTMLMQMLGTSSKGGGGKGGSGGGGGGGGNMQKIMQKARTTSSNTSGAAMGAAVGGFQLIRGLRQRKKADAMVPENEDPDLNILIRNNRRLVRAYQTGTAQERERFEIRSGAKEGANAVFSSGRGLRGGLNMLSAQTNQGILALNAQGQNTMIALANLDASLTEKAVQRKLDLSMYRHLKKSAIAENNVQAGSSNLLAAAAQMTDTNQDGGAVNLDTGGGGRTQGPNAGSQAPRAANGGSTFTQNDAIAMSDARAASSTTGNMNVDPNQGNGNKKILTEEVPGMGQQVDAGSMSGMASSFSY